MQGTRTQVTIGKYNKMLGVPYQGLQSSPSNLFSVENLHLDIIHVQCSLFVNIVRWGWGQMSEWSKKID